MVAELPQERLEVTVLIPPTHNVDPALQSALSQFRRSSKDWEMPFTLRNIGKPWDSGEFRSLGINPAWLEREIRSHELVRRYDELNVPTRDLAAAPSRR